MIVKVKHDSQTKPGLVLTRIWMGDTNFPFRLAGCLMFTPKEWEAFHKLLKDGGLFKSSTLMVCDEADGSSRNLPRIDPS